MAVLLGLLFYLEQTTHTLLLIEQWENVPLHSTIEALGMLAAILMCMVLLQRRRKEDEGTRSVLAMSFLSMGMLDGFHAICHPGQSFVFLHSMAGLAGGIGFALSWSPNLGKYASR